MQATYLLSPSRKLRPTNRKKTHRQKKKDTSYQKRTQRHTDTHSHIQTHTAPPLQRPPLLLPERGKQRNANNIGKDRSAPDEPPHQASTTSAHEEDGDLAAARCTRGDFLYRWQRGDPETNRANPRETHFDTGKAEEKRESEGTRSLTQEE